MATKRPARLVSGGGDSHFHVALQNGDCSMNTVLKLMDRAGLGLINLLVLAGLPLVAVGLMTNAI